MTQLLNQFSESIMALAAGAAPLLTAIRVGPNRQVTGFLWRGDLVVTTDQALPAAAAYTVVLANGALISARPGPRDPMHNLAALLLDASVQVQPPEPATGTAAGALVLALGADFDGSPTVRLTTIHGFPRTQGGGQGAAITLDLAGNRVAPGGMIVDTAGKLLGMTNVSPAGDAIVMPHGTIARFVAAATAGAAAEPETQIAPLQAIQPIPPVSVSTQAINVTRDTNGQTLTRAPATGRRGWLGVSLQPITVPEALVYRAGQPTARQVVSVTRGGPADHAGLRSGDVLLSLDGASTSGNHALRAFLAPDKIGSRVEIRLMRDGVVHTTVLTVAAQP